VTAMLSPGEFVALLSASTCRDDKAAVAG